MANNSIQLTHSHTHRHTHILGFDASSVEFFLPFCKTKPTKQLHFKRLTNHISLLSFLLCFSPLTTCCCCWCCCCNQCHCHGNLHTHKMQHKTTQQQQQQQLLDDDDDDDDVLPWNPSQLQLGIKLPIKTITTTTTTTWKQHEQRSLSPGHHEF